MDELLRWTREVFMPIGDVGLFILAFLESSVFPVPPDVLLIALALANPALALYYATIATIGSVLGGVAGYYIGLKGGRRVAKRIFSERMIERADNYFKEYGVWAVLIAAFSPIPYKVFTIASGIFRLSLKGFIIASIIGRGARFYAEGLLIMLWGEQILAFVDENLELISLAIAGAIISYLVLRKRLAREKKRRVG
ncbi:MULTISPECIES: YqaA family protein [Candidatus Nitrosocaldus]|uniref:YqaA family protein n=1 Tax=Candidatus Nitrosocaldus TaxID=498374 RepID=UPI0011E5EC26|nr:MULTISPECIES: YqaA family protein [Candidatus Nitrosocaldus]